jgi:DnaJ like chaperone protein
MGWFGKLIGGTTGFFIGGPIGAILGAAVGHSFDKRAEIQGSGKRNYRHYSSSGSQTFSSNDQTQMIFFVATFSMLGKMAAADGQVSSSEIRAIEDFIDRNLRLNIAEKEFAMRIVNTSAASREPFEKFAQQFYSLFNRQPQMLQTMYDILQRVATADNSLTKDEEKILEAAANIFNLNSRGSSASYSTGSSSDKNYSILGCKKTDSSDTIKSAYKKLVKDYHPDTIASKGLPEEFTKFAAEKFREINQAYEEIRKERNF